MKEGEGILYDASSVFVNIEIIMMAYNIFGMRKFLLFSISAGCNGVWDFAAFTMVNAEEWFYVFFIFSIRLYLLYIEIWFYARITNSTEIM